MSAPLDLIGKVLDEKYLIQKQLGQGGMGAVFAAVHVGTSRPVAVKVIMPRFMEEAEFVERFKREAKASGQILHPNVVNVTDFGFARVGSDKVAYLVMEYLKGRTLNDLLAEQPFLPLNVCADIVEQVCLAVGEAHNRGIVHRDLKPENIFLQDDGRGSFIVKVLDFGIAKLVSTPEERAKAPGISRPAIEIVGASKSVVLRGVFDPGSTLVDQSQSEVETISDTGRRPAIEPEAVTLIQGPKDFGGTLADGSPGGSDSVTLLDRPGEAATLIESAEAAGTETGELTFAGAILGTPVYMSPEQCQGEPLDARSDIYSLGVVAYRMLAGGPPFGGSLLEILRGHIEHAPEDPTRKNPAIPKSVAAVILSALSKKPTDRPQGAAAFSAAFRAGAEGELPILREAFDTYRKHFRTLFSTSLSVLVPVALIHVAALSLTMTGLQRAGFSMHGVSGMFGVWPWAVTFPLFLFACTLNAGVFTGVVKRLKIDPKSEDSKADVSDRKLFGTGVLFLRAAVVGLFTTNVAPLRNFSLFAPVVELEGTAGREALSRSEQLVERLPSVMNFLQIRYVMACAFAALLTPICFVSVGAVISAVGFDRIEILAERGPALPSQVYVPLVFSFFPWLIVGVLQPLVGTATALYYFKVLRIGNEPRGLAVRADGGRVQDTISPAASRLRVLSIVALFSISALAWHGLKNTLLVFAAETRLQPAVESLLVVGADPNARIRPELLTEFETTPLLRALEGDNSDLVNLLLDQGADVNLANKYKWTPLMEVIHRGKPELAEMLVGRGANVNARHNYGWTPLMLAAQTENVDLVEFLLVRGAEVDARNSDGDSALAVAVERGNVYVVKSLLERHADANSTDGDGSTPLHVAARRGDPYLIRLLLEGKADPNRKNADGWTPFLLAVGRGNLDAVKTLLDGGAEANAQVGGMTALMIAEERGHPRVAELLKTR